MPGLRLLQRTNRAQLFAHNLLERIEGAGEQMWVWLGTGQWQLLFLLGLLSLMFQLFFWSEVVQVNHRSTGTSE